MSYKIDLLCSLFSRENPKSLSFFFILSRLVFICQFWIKAQISRELLLIKDSLQVCQRFCIITCCMLYIRLIILSKLSTNIY